MECFYVGEVGAGFPSPAERWRERTLDLNDLLQAHPEATFFMLVRGESMKEANIFDGDLVVVDRALRATHGSIIIALVNGGFSIKQLRIRSDGSMELASAHPRFPPLMITPRVSFEVWGVVIFVVRSTHPTTPLKTRLHRFLLRSNP